MSDCEVSHLEITPPGSTVYSPSSRRMQKRLDERCTTTWVYSGMSERETWLARTRETALEPELQICDPHHHLWDYPGNRYLVDELLGDIDGSGHRVTSTVFVECLTSHRKDGPEALRPVGETETIERMAAASARSDVAVAAGIVGFADLTRGAAVREVLEAHLAASERFRGIRHASAWDASPEIRPAHSRPPQALLGRKEFREGFACLRQLGLSFDAWLYHTQITELTVLAREFPEVAIVLDHVGGPLGIGRHAGKRAEVFASWLDSIRELARCPNVHVKLGGLAMPLNGFGWHERDTPPGSRELADATAPYYDACIEHFGPERCMFESNFPVDRTSCSYGVLWNSFKLATQRYGAAERRALFHDTAARVDRLKGAEAT